jgi:hypothetical protein
MWESCHPAPDRRNSGLWRPVYAVARRPRQASAPSTVERLRKGAFAPPRHFSNGKPSSSRIRVASAWSLIGHLNGSLLQEHSSAEISEPSNCRIAGLCLFRPACTIACASRSRKDSTVGLWRRPHRWMVIGCRVSFRLRAAQAVAARMPYRLESNAADIESCPRASTSRTFLTPCRAAVGVSLVVGVHHAAD